MAAATFDGACRARLETSNFRSVLSDAVGDAQPRPGSREKDETDSTDEE